MANIGEIRIKIQMKRGGKTRLYFIKFLAVMHMLGIPLAWLIVKQFDYVVE